MDRIRAWIQVCGIVQGVGFRPFLHRQMEENGLSGWIRNTSEGVELEAEGTERGVDALLDRICHSAPELASVEQVHEKRFKDLNGYL